MSIKMLVKVVCWSDILLGVDRCCARFTDKMCMLVVGHLPSSLLVMPLPPPALNLNFCLHF